MSRNIIQGTYNTTVEVGSSDTSAVVLTVDNPTLASSVAYLDATQRDALIAALGGTHAEPVFKENARFEDIRKGDRVRRTITYPHGTTEVIEGSVDHISYYAVWDADENSLHDRDDDDDPRVTLTILSRPTPEPPANPSLDRNGNAWWCDQDENWHCMTDPHVPLLATKQLIEQFGPLRPAKVVEVTE